MIQRIQTIFLLLVLIAQVLFLSFPISNYVLTNHDTLELTISGLKDQGGEAITSNVPLLLLSIIVLILIIVDIFLYRKRILQIRICIYTILLNIGLIGLLLWQLYSIHKQYQLATVSFNWTVVIPLVNIILLYLAFRGIRKDEVLVKAYERLR